MKKPYGLGRVLAERDADATLEVELLHCTAAGVAEKLQRPGNDAVLGGGGS